MYCDVHSDSDDGDVFSSRPSSPRHYEYYAHCNLHERLHCVTDDPPISVSAPDTRDHVDPADTDHSKVSVVKVLHSIYMLHVIQSFHSLHIANSSCIDCHVVSVTVPKLSPFSATASAR